MPIAADGVGTPFFDATFLAQSPRWIRHYGLRAQTYKQFDTELYEGINVGAWGRPHWGLMSWGLWDPFAGFPYPAYPDQPSRYPRHYGRTIAGSPIDQADWIFPTLPSASTGLTGRGYFPDLFPEWRSRRFRGTPTGQFGPVPFESILPAVVLPQGMSDTFQRAGTGRYNLREAVFGTIPSTLFGTKVWTEPSQAPVVTSWTEPAQAAISTSWTEPAQGAITTVWTEPAVTPITPSPEA